MSRTVDLVIAGDCRAAVSAAADALRRGRRVLVVLRSGDTRAGPRLRRNLGKPGPDAGRITVLTRAEVVCVDGVHGVEAVVIRNVQTGRLWAVNASLFVSCEGSTTPAVNPPGESP